MIALETPALTLGDRTVLRDVAIQVIPGELVAICGPNGAGKTTLLRALAGLLPGTPPRDARRVAYLPQGASCGWSMTVAQVAMLGRIPRRDAAEAPVRAALERCGIAHLAAERMDRISGGEARRAMLARAFATEPNTFLLDEPTADLDPAAAHDLMHLLRQTAESGRCVIAVLHAIDLATRYAHRIIVLHRGHIIADQPPEHALPVLGEAFGLPVGPDPRPRLLPRQNI